MQQLEFTFDNANRAAPDAKTTPTAQPVSASSLVSFLGRALNRPVRLTLTDNRSTMISWRERDGVMDLRIHRMFQRADQQVLQSLARYIENDTKDDGAVVDAFIAHSRPKWTTALTGLRPKGRFHDLARLFARLNAEYFDGRCRARITWGRRSRPRGFRRRRRTIQLGIFIHDAQLIRLHPVLDQAFVPEYYVAGVIYHEMLHEDLGITRPPGGQRTLHSGEFKHREQGFRHHQRFTEWEKQNLARLLAW